MEKRVPGMPMDSTVRALRAVKGKLTYGALCQKLGYAPSAMGMLSDVVHARTHKISLERENELRVRLGLPEVTEKGYKRRKDERVRPTASEEQEGRRQKLGVEWPEVIEMG